MSVKRNGWSVSGDGDATPVVDWDAVNEARNVGDIAGAVTLLEAIRKQFPTCGRASYLLGTCLLESGQEAGLEHLKFTMAQDETATPAVCRQAASFLQSRGQQSAADGYLNKLKAWEEAADEQLNLGAAPEAGAVLLPGSLRHIEAIQAFLSGMKCALSCAYVVEQAREEWHAENTVWLLVKLRNESPEIITRAGALLRMSAEACGEVRPGVVVLDEAAVDLYRQVRHIEGACLWDRDVIFATHTDKAAQG